MYYHDFVYPVLPLTSLDTGPILLAILFNELVHHRESNASPRLFLQDGDIGDALKTSIGHGCVYN